MTYHDPDHDGHADPWTEAVLWVAFVSIVAVGTGSVAWLIELFN